MKASQKLPKDLQARGLNIIPRSSWKTLAINDSTNDLNRINAPKIQKPKLGIWKTRRNDIKWSNSCDD
jgi:hypothetical protein